MNRQNIETYSIEEVGLFPRIKNIIYAIIDKKGKELYVGMTAREARTRWKEHKRELEDGWHSNIALQIAYDKLAGDLYFAVLQRVKTITEIEREWIDKVYARNKDLCNEA